MGIANLKKVRAQKASFFKSNGESRVTEKETTNLSDSLPVSQSDLAVPFLRFLFNRSKSH
jgi:hypothetical protein